MIANPIDVNTAFPVRKSKVQKQAFRDAVIPYVQALGYECTTEKGMLGARNVVIGNSETAKYLITAHYDTCAHLPFPNLITPCSFWLFMAYQLVIAAFMLLIPLIPTIAADWLFDTGAASSMVWYAFFLLGAILMMVGPANKHNANDNTSGVVAVLEIARKLPAELRSQVCFVLFDLEEAGLFGSMGYQEAHKNATKNQLVLNLDCVGDGDEIMLFPSGKVKKDQEKMELLRSCCGSQGNKRISIREKGFSFYPSDQANFPYGVGIAALRRSKVGLYLGRIHTNRDTILEEANIHMIRDAILSMIAAHPEYTPVEPKKASGRRLNASGILFLTTGILFLISAWLGKDFFNVGLGVFFLALGIGKLTARK